jgi:hypothetical protein
MSDIVNVTRIKYIKAYTHLNICNHLPSLFHSARTFVRYAFLVSDKIIPLRLQFQSSIYLIELCSWSIELLLIYSRYIYIFECFAISYDIITSVIFKSINFISDLPCSRLWAGVHIKLWIPFAGHHKQNLPYGCLHLICTSYR